MPTRPGSRGRSSAGAPERVSYTRIVRIGAQSTQRAGRRPAGTRAPAGPAGAAATIRRSMSRARTAQAAPRGAGAPPGGPAGVAARWVDVLAGERLRIAVDGPADGQPHVLLRERASGAEAVAPLEPTGAADGSRQAVLDLRALASGRDGAAPSDSVGSQPPVTASPAPSTAAPAPGERPGWGV